MDQLQIVGFNALEATREEYEKVLSLQQILTDYLANSASESLSKSVRQAVANFSEDQDILLKFVRGRKLNLQKARDSVISFANVKYHFYPELFSHEVPDFVHHALQNNILSVLKNQDSLGRTIVLFRVSKWDVKEISLEEILCTGRYFVEALMNLPDFLIKGACLLTDCNEASLSHARHFTIPTIVKFVKVFWQAYPIQIKGFYFVNSPIFVKPVYAIGKPFLPAKMKERMLITSGVSELHKLVEPGILPKSLGGALTDDEALSLSFMQLP